MRILILLSALVSLTVTSSAQWQTLFDGKSPSKPLVLASVVAPNGDIYIAGPTRIGDVEVNGLARWDGTQWHPLGSGIARGTYVSAMILDANGDLIISGEFKAVGGIYANNIARWDGSKWNDMNGGADQAVIDLALYRGNVIAGGYFKKAGNRTVNHLAMWSLDSGWRAFGNGASDRVSCIATSDSSLYIGGEFSRVDTVDARWVARFDGTRWHDMHHGRAWPGGTLLFASKPSHMSSNANGLYTFVSDYIFHWTGERWRRLDSGATKGTQGYIRAFEAGPDGVYISTESLGYGGFRDHPAHHVERWDGTQWTVLDDGSMRGFTTSARRFAFANNSVYVLGDFNRAGMQAASGIARWDGTRFHPLTADLMDGIDPIINKVAYAHGKLYVGGDFSVGGANVIEHLASWDGSHWSSLGRGPNYPVSDMCADGDDLYVAGKFARVDTLESWFAARWDGERWDSLPLVGRGEQNINEIAAGDGEVYIATQFWNSSGGGYDYLLHRLVGNEWVRLGETNRNVSEMIVADGDLIIAGSFMSIDGDTIRGIARWRRSTGEWESIGGGLNVDNSLIIWAATALMHEGKLYVGGSFQRAGTLAVSNVAMWDGTQWHRMGTFTATGSAGVRGMLIRDGKLVIAGSFQKIDGDSIRGAAWWSGERWHGFGDGLSRNGQFPLVQTASIGPDNSIFFAGNFTHAGDLPARELAAWNGPLSSIEQPERGVQSTAAATVRPNPAHDRVSISFTLDRRTHTRVTLIDVLGATVATIADELMDAGTQERSIDASSLSSGYYRIMLATSEGTSVSALQVVR